MLATRRGFVLSTAALLCAVGCEGLFGVDFDGLTPRPPVVPAPDASAGGSIDGCEAGSSCGGRCVASDDVESACGSGTCTPCPTVENGERTCAPWGCAVACATGFRRCQSGCCPEPDSALAAGIRHACATTSGALACWGANEAGQLGDGSRVSRTSPKLVLAGLESGASSVAVAADATVASTSGGATLSWGAGALGLLGDPLAASPRERPGRIPGLDDTRIVVAAGYHACAVDRVGGVHCWGYDAGGVVGNGATVGIVTTPARVTLGEATVDLATGSSHACAVGVSGAVRCWGANDRGQLGDPAAAGGAAPVVVKGLPPARAVTAGGAHSCALLRDGAVRCWGANADGQLATGDTADTDGLVDPLGADARATSLAAGDRFTCATQTSGATLCWGTLVPGARLGVGAGPSTGPTVRPVLVDVRGLAASVVAGAQHACARLLDGAVRCWGANDSGQLGNGTTAASPVPVDVLLP